jgi:hypothetical protein
MLEYLRLESGIDVRGHETWDSIRESRHCTARTAELSTPQKTAAVVVMVDCLIEVRDCVSDAYRVADHVTALLQDISDWQERAFHTITN